MARSAIPAELTFMNILRGMAGEAISRRTLEDSIDMTRLTFRSFVRSGQLEACLVVIELSRLPRIRSVTLSAVFSKLT